MRSTDWPHYMLVFLILFATLQPLRGAPVGPSNHTGTTGTPNLFGRDDLSPQDLTERDSRTKYAIIQSCLLTIFACVWTAIHPNINGPRDSWWTRWKRKVVTALYAVTAPEMILLWAMKQNLAAKKIAEAYNSEFVEVAKTEPISKEGWSNGIFRPLPKSTTRRGTGPPWTKTHGFFLQMGGFMLYKGEYPVEVLNYERLAELLRNKAIDQPTVTERELQDRSKGDAVSKGIVVWQTTWFAVQCCTRLAHGLPLSELEVLTLAFAVVNVAIYAAWWDKPQSVDMAIWLPLKAAEKNINDLETLPTSPVLSTCGDEVPELKSPLDPDVPRQIADTEATNATHCPENLEPVPNDVNHDDWICRMLRKDRENYALTIFLLFRLPYRYVTSLLRPFAKIGEPRGFQGTRLRTPMFYGSQSDMSVRNCLSLTLIGVLFGAVHLISWGSPFPSPLDRILWRSAAFGLIAPPFFMFLAAIVAEVRSSRWFGANLTQTVQRAMEILENAFLYVSTVFLPLYGPARFVVIVLALKAIHNPPEGVLWDLSWTSYIPHL